MTEHELLPVLERYRGSYPPDLLRAAIELTLLRRRGKAKFTRAEAMYFTREGLEMASAEAVARHTARRFSGLPRVFDLCCGIGGDALALAPLVGELIAVDRDPLALAMAQANAQAYGDGGARAFRASQTSPNSSPPPHPLPPSSSIPAVASGPAGKRPVVRVSRRPEEYSPPLSWCLR